ncbi:MAG: coenzyme F420-0:L-glutamate ligase [Acidobacteria bacterium]|nr:coenzyme F420-0:L-glutamate ligase [Acidobacteriota bacterium]
MLTLRGLEGLPEVQAGDDLARLLLDGMLHSGAEPADGDVVVVCHKVVSKAEGRLVELKRLRPTKIARAWAAEYGRDPREVQAVLGEARDMVRVQRGVLVTETRHGFVCANSGVDRSNVPDGHVCLLPEDPDASARELAERLSEATETRLGVVITDTWGRPFRLGAVNVAIGIAVVPALHDYRGQADFGGRTLQSSTMAVADELAGAAGLVMGKLRRIPAVLAQGVPSHPGAEPGTGASLLRSRGEDIFR